MLLKHLALLLLVQLAIAAPRPINPESFDSNDPVQLELQRRAKQETVNLLDSLFRSQIAYFTEVRAKLNPHTKRAGDISLYVTRLNEAIAQTDLESKEKVWFDIFDEFKKSPLLLNRESETGLTNKEYETLLTGKKLQDISTRFVSNVSDYVWKMAEFSGKAVDHHLDGFLKTPSTKA